MSNEFEGTVEVAWIGDKLNPPILVKPVADDSNGGMEWYHPTKHKESGLEFFKFPKKFARHLISTQPDRWRLMGDEKFTIRITNREGIHEWVDFYPWAYKPYSRQVIEGGQVKKDENNKPVYEKGYEWVENKDAK